MYLQILAGMYYNSKFCQKYLIEGGFMKNFNQAITKELIDKANEAKLKNQTLLSGFITFAKNYGYSVGSVRNHYYKIVKNTKKGCDLYKKLGLSDRLKPAFIKEFTLAEEKELLYLIAKGVAQGKSVRKTLLEISCGSEKLALRYQNKFRNLVRNNSPLIALAIKKVEEETGVKVFFQKRKKSIEQKLIESKINQMLQDIINGVNEKNRLLQLEKSKLEKENALLKKVVKNTMKDKRFKEFAQK